MHFVSIKRDLQVHILIFMSYACPLTLWAQDDSIYRVYSFLIITILRKVQLFLQSSTISTNLCWQVYRPPPPATRNGVTSVYCDGW